jgi:superoxide dismutase, Fe-Mn family
MGVEFPELPFAADALEPYISKRTIEFHYGKHHKGYVEKLNKLIEGTAFEDQALEEIVCRSKEDGETEIFNNAGQAWNHDFYWHCLTKKGDGPSSEFEKILRRDFGSIDEFKDSFANIGKKLFGSGWTWLVKDNKDRLKVRPMPNAENPLITGETPVLTCDVWEHAYYLDYQNDRGQYLDKFWNLVNWRFVEANFALLRTSAHTDSHEESSRVH